MNAKTRVAVVGYGVIGKRVVEALAVQPDMVLSGVADVAADWRTLSAAGRGIPIHAAAESASAAMRAAGLAVSGSLDDLIRTSDIVVDCTPKRIGARNADLYRAAGTPFILHGGSASSARPRPSSRHRAPGRRCAHRAPGGSGSRAREARCS